MQLDAATLAILVGMILTTLVVCMTVLAIIVRRQRAVWLWCAAYWLVIAFSYLPTPMGQGYPGHAVVLGYSCFLFFNALIAQGIIDHLERPWGAWFSLSIVLVGYLVLAGAVLSGAELSLVIPLMGVVWNAWLLYALLAPTPVGIRVSRWTMMLPLGIDTAYAVIQSVVYGVGIQPQGGLLQMLAVAPVVGVASHLLLTFALILMVVQKMVGRLRHLADHDPLTGLLNRAALKREARRCLPAGSTPSVLLLMDLDRFKSINDKWGHPLGDRVLKHVSTVLNEASTPERGLLSRHGGEEFLVLVPGAGLDIGQALAERLRASVEARPFTLDDGQVVPITISIGGTLLRHAALASAIEAADAALYQAKQQGRNRVVWITNK